MTASISSSVSGQSKSYEEFLQSKRIADVPTGLIVPDSALSQHLSPFQRAVTRWELKRGRGAIFADTGMGKTRMQLEWSRQIQESEGGQVLILAPLCVGQQTEREAALIGLDARYCRTPPSDPGIWITNYERMDAFPLERYKALVLDESSILKSIGGKTRAALLSRSQGIPFRLSCTATPSPNDYMEFGGQSEFLSVMPHSEMLATFFIHDSSDTAKWRLKRHANNGFWEWIASWAVYFKKPSDLGFDDAGYDLPLLTFHEHTVEGGETLEGFLFPVQAETLSERLTARRQTVEQRCAKAVELANSDTEQWIVWCNLNDESDYCARNIKGAIEVSGAHKLDVKEERINAFLTGSARVLVTKPSIAGFGLNMQHCNRMVFVGLNDSYEQLYQAVRRCWRFGQKKPVQVHLVAATIEGAVVANIHRKEKQATELQSQMATHMKELVRSEIDGNADRSVVELASGEVASGDGWELHNKDCVDLARSIESDSVGISVFSPPFSSLYVYSASERDMGNVKSDAEFFQHFDFLIRELYRVIQPGRHCVFHCMNLPSTKVHDGHIGIRDFRGDLIRAFEAAGFIYHSEVCIWKDPVTAMQRTKALGLLHKTIRTDSSMSRMGIPDYIIAMRKPGENKNPIAHDPAVFPVSLWQEWASPVWMDIRQTNVLNRAGAKDKDDEKHIAPLQLDVIERCLTLWSNPGDLVFSPFTGIGSEGFMAVRMGRRFIGSELKPSYFRIACDNLRKARTMQDDLFSTATEFEDTEQSE
jgi:hypothetical protein